MNSKTAKRLRREANYHPTDERKYTMDGSQNKGRGGPIELDESCSRVLYKELKKEHKNGQNSNG